MNYNRFLAGRANWIKSSALSLVMSKAVELKKKGVKLISLAAGDPDPNIIPRRVLGDLAMEIIKNNPLSVLYTPTNGIPELRDELSAFLNKYENLHIPPDNIVITIGGSEALDLLGRVLIDPGDIVLSDNPVYINTSLAFKQLGGVLEPIAVDEDGMKTHLLGEKVKKILDMGGKIKFIYTIATGQNPMGVTMSLDRRKELLEIASKYDLLVVEDAAYNFMKYNSQSIPSLKSLDKEGRVIMVGTFSKIIGTGFRIGWIIAEDEILKKVVMEKQPIDFCAPTISQYISLEYLKRGFFEKYHLDALQKYKMKRDAMINALKENLKNIMFTKPIAGMFIMVFLETSVDGVQFSENLLYNEHIIVVPGKPFYIDDTGANTIRLNFSRPSEEEIKEGVEKLAKAYKDFSS